MEHIALSLTVNVTYELQSYSQCLKINLPATSWVAVHFLYSSRVTTEYWTGGGKKEEKKWNNKTRVCINVCYRTCDSPMRGCVNCLYISMRYIVLNFLRIAASVQMPKEGGGGAITEAQSMCTSIGQFLVLYTINLLGRGLFIVQFANSRKPACNLVYNFTS